MQKHLTCSITILPFISKLNRRNSTLRCQGDSDSDTISNCCVRRVADGWLKSNLMVTLVVLPLRSHHHKPAFIGTENPPFNNCTFYTLCYTPVGHHTTANPYNCSFFVLGSVTESRVSLNVRVYIDITLLEDNGRNHLCKCVTTNACRSINVLIHFNETSHTRLLLRNFGRGL